MMHRFVWTNTRLNFQRPLFILPRATFNLSPPSANIACSVARNHFTASRINKRSLPNQPLGGLRYVSQKSLDKHKRRSRVPIYLLSLMAFVSFGTFVHSDDDYFFYFYPLPFALDIGHGPSMLPTIPLKTAYYLRDCWSHRLVWFDFNHFRSCISGLLSDQSTKQRNISFRRPWQKGDIVTLYNPLRKSLGTKRIIGLGGDSIKVFGEYARDFERVNDRDKNDGPIGHDCGVPPDWGFPTPYCQKVFMDAKNQTLSQHRRCETTIIVPANHVWLEGDNPLTSVDSRHYGPLPVSSLRGRVVLRLWPSGCNCYSKSKLEDGKHMVPENCPCLSKLDSKRPVPFMDNEWLEVYGIDVPESNQPKRQNRT